METKKCKLSFEEKNGKIILKQRGYCDEKNANKIVNRDIEMDMKGMAGAMGKLIDDLEES